MKTTLRLAIVVFFLPWGSAPAAVAGTDREPALKPASEVVSTSEVVWGPLNPARGEKGPRAGDLWGDRTGPGPSGFLVEFADGFSSPPHIHNVTYRGVVIRGLVHNDDPEAMEMWMPTGSFWTQPAGEVHVTSAEGRHNLAYIEIEEGPYLVRPTEEAFDHGERPLNVDASNIVWLDASEIVWLDQPGSTPSEGAPKVACLWREAQSDGLSGTLVRLPIRYAGAMLGRGSTLRAVVIQGRLRHQVPDETGVETLEPGSYFGSEGRAVHQVSCEAGEECILYVRTAGRFDVVPAKPDE